MSHMNEPCESRHVIYVCQSVAVCCSVLQCVAVCCSVLQCVICVSHRGKKGTSPCE